MDHRRFNDRMRVMLDPNLHQFYQSRLKEGKTPSEQSGWPRTLEDGSNPVWHLFDELFQCIDLEACPSILDFGCGTGSMVEYLKAKNFWDKITYHGIDIVPEVIETAKKSFPFASFSCQDILEAPLTKHFDWVLINGTFNYLPKPNPSRLLHRMLQATFSNCKIGTAFTISSDYAFRVHPHYQLSSSFLYYSNPSNLFAFCRELTPHIALFHAHHFLNVSTFILHKKTSMPSQKAPSVLQEKLMAGHYSEILKDTDNLTLSPLDKWVRIQAFLHLHKYGEMIEEFVELLAQGKRPFSHYSYSLQLPKVDMHYLLEMIELLTRRSLFNNHLPQVDRLIPYLPDEALQSGVKGLIAFTQKNYSLSCTLCQIALDHYPSWILIREHLAQTYEALRLTENALSEYETILAINPEEPRMLTRYILLLIDQKEWKKILTTLDTYPENDFIRDCRDLILSKLKSV